MIDCRIGAYQNELMEKHLAKVGKWIPLNAEHGHDASRGRDVFGDVRIFRSSEDFCRGKGIPFKMAIRICRRRFSSD